MMRRIAPLVALAALCLSCTGGGDGDGVLILARVEDGALHIIEHDIGEGDERRLVSTPDVKTTVRDPAVSPDGESIAWVQVLPLARQQDGRLDFSSDIWVADRDGGDARIAYEHDQPNLLFFEPQWIDGAQMVAIVQAARDPADQRTFALALERLNLNDGSRQRLLEEVFSLGASADGTRLVFGRITPAGATLQVSDVNGGDARVVVGPQSGLILFRSPRFSPDGETIVFAAYSFNDRQGRLGRRIQDGEPMGIWAVPAAGGDPRLLADIEEVEPVLAWSSDGEHLYAAGPEALYRIDPDSGAFERLGAGIAHSQIAWAPE